MCSSSAKARVVFLARSSSAPAQPTQKRYSTSVRSSTSLTDDGDLEVEALRPVQAGPRGHAPRVALVLQVLQHRAGLGRERRLDQHLEAPHVDDVVDVLDVDGALLDAGAARRARPEHVGVDDAALGLGADERAVRLGALSGMRPKPDSGTPWCRPVDARSALSLPASSMPVTAAPSAPQDGRRLREQVVAQVHDHELRRQRLPGVPGRALRLAPPALGARREVEHALPGEVLDLAAAEDVVLAGVLEVDRLAAGGHRQQRAERLRLALGEHVQRREEDVQVLGVDDQHEEAEDHPDLGQDAEASRGSRWCPRPAARAPWRRPPRRTPRSRTGRRRC